MANKFAVPLGAFVDRVVHFLRIGVNINPAIVQTINNGTNQSFKLGLQVGDYTGRVAIPHFEAKTLRVPKNNEAPTINTSI